MFDFTISISEKLIVGVIADDETVCFVSTDCFRISEPFYFDYIMNYKEGLQIDKGFYLNKYDIEITKIRLQQYLNGN